MKSQIRQPLKILVLLLPLLLPLLVQNEYYVHGILGRIIVYTILVASLDLVTGYIGDISIGHAGLFAVGAYTMAIFNSSAAANLGSTIQNFHQWSFLLSLVVAVIVTACFGFLLGFPSLKASGPYLAVTTIAYGSIIHTIINEQEALTNGTKGIQMSALMIGDFSFEGNRFIWVCYPFLVLVMYIKNNLSKSYWGRAFEAIKYSGIAAESSGIARARFKISAFVLSAAIAGLAGALFTHLDNYIAPNTFTLDFSILSLMALIFGGVRSILGNIIGMSLVVILPDLFTWFKDWRLMFFGILLLLALFFLPNGLAGWIHQIMEKYFPNLQNKYAIDEIRERAIKMKISFFAESPQAAKKSEPVAIMELKNLEMKFGGLAAVNQLSLELRPGKIHGLMGPNGSGKSTTINLITGLYQPTQGEILFFGKSARKLTPYQRANMGIARTFQNLQIFGELSVLDNVMVGLHRHHQSSFISVISGLPWVKREEAQHLAEAYNWLKFVGIEHLAQEKAKNLAYGQARRMEIARALALRPKVLLLDEPAAGLTSKEIQEFNNIIVKVKEQQVAILLIEHHMEMMMEISDEITVLDFGKKIAQGTPQQIQDNPLVIQAYLGTEGVKNA